MVRTVPAIKVILMVKTNAESPQEIGGFWQIFERQFELFERKFELLKHYKRETKSEKCIFSRITGLAFTRVGTSCARVPIFEKYTL